MALGRSRRSSQSVDYWPGFVDALSTILLSFMFLLSVFVLGQFILNQEISSKDSVLDSLNQQISELTELLALERAESQDLATTLASLQAGLLQSEDERSRLQQLLDAEKSGGEESQNELLTANNALSEEKKISERALNQVTLLNQQISALRKQIAVLEDALEASEKRDRESESKIADLGKRLNVALAQRVQELNRYRSDFFGRLREILSDRADIRVVGDRFVFQSEVLFGSGSQEINSAGETEMTKLADALRQLEDEIPAEINWILRVDGHTDNIPLSGSGPIKSNLELSAFRAISVVNFLVSQGVSAKRLLPAGFGESQPLDPSDTDEARAKNRRIELKLTER